MPRFRDSASNASHSAPSHHAPCGQCDVARNVPCNCMPADSTAPPATQPAAALPADGAAPAAYDASRDNSASDASGRWFNPAGHSTADANYSTGTIEFSGGAGLPHYERSSHPQRSCPYADSFHTSKIPTPS